MVTVYWSFAYLVAAVVAVTSITLSSDKIQNGDILVLANPGPPGKWPLKWRESVYSRRESAYSDYKLVDGDND